MAGFSPFRTPWTAALVLLLVIWSIWLLGMPAHRSVPVLSSGGGVANPQVPTGRPGSGYHEPQLQESASPEPTRAKAVTSISHPSHVAKPTSVKQSFATASKANVSAAHETPLPADSSSKSDRPLILYAYKETAEARENIEFFIRHGLHGAADFIFIFNGETDAQNLLPSDKDNIRFINRPNECFDLGAYAEVLTTKGLYKSYKRFILLNASIRGPFLPYWAGSCWSDIYLNKLNEETKLVGMTANCWPKFHVQSMIWALDSTGVQLLLFPPKDASKAEDEQAVGINKCFDGWQSAVQGEIGATSVITDAGYKIDVMMGLYHKEEHYAETCDSSQNSDPLYEGGYGGTTIHPYDTMFIKTKRGIDPVMIEKLTEWHNGRKYSSWDQCH